MAKVILQYAHDLGPRSKVNASIVHQYDVASRFYPAVVYGGLRVATELMWLPQPFWHPLRDRAIDLFIEFSDVPWVPEEDEMHENERHEDEELDWDWGHPDW